MKKMRRLALLLALGLVLLAGCGAPAAQGDVPPEATAAPAAAQEPTPEPMDAVTLAGNIARAAEGLHMTGASGVTSFGITIAAEGETLEMNVASAMEMRLALDPYRAYTKSVTETAFAGQEMSETTESYIVPEEDKLVNYLYMESTGQWVKTEVDLDTEALAAQEGNFHWLAAKAADELVLEEGTQQVGGREAYVLRATLTGQEMKQTVGNGEAASLLSSMGMGDADITSLAIDTVFYVDAETYLPLAFDMELQGLDAMLQAVLAGNADLAAAGVEMQISPVTLNYTDITYDPVEIPAVPEEAIASALTTE